ncbi:MAG TPA: DUF6599 family protein [Isosphaeraceae bacterium]|jgi:hypothetical protein|nr:DUF6599 family protein [Isosphaeraceae bacterium]
MNSPGVLTQLSDFFWADPLLGVAIAAAVIALATTPVAFAVMGRLEWFHARRGRTLLKPSFVSIVCAMLLVMGIPAIFLALVVKSRYFDKDRYEFDPNKTLTVIDQGRGYETREEINTAIRAEMQRLAHERKNLVENVKKLDEAMITLRAAAGSSPTVAQAIPNVLQRLAGVRRSVGLDGPQQLMDFTAPPVELAAAPLGTTGSGTQVVSAPVPAAAAAAPAVATNGLPKAEIAAELAAVPDPERPLAAMLPLDDLPAGWSVGKAMGASGKARLESFNASNLFEKINGRAESFIDYGVKGMAYTFYHPTGDESGEVQLYTFEMGSPLKSFGKYGAEKSDDAKPVAVGTDGYTAAGSTFFYVGPYYTQLVSNKDEPKYAAFALELAKRIAAKQKGDASQAPAAGDAQASGQPAAATPESMFGLLPAGPKRASPKYVAADVFGYSFLSDVFMADYQDGDITWQGFLRPYASPEAAREVFEKYLASAKQDGAELAMMEVEGADKMVRSANVGLIDFIFLKGNAVGGANGATEAAKAEAFARSFVKALPTKVPFLDNQSPAGKDEENPEPK